MQHDSVTSRDSTYPAELARSWAPIFGQWLTIRPIRADDAEIETAFFHGLSEQTRYNRFLGAGVQPDAALLKRFTDIDYADHMAWIATLMLDEGEIQVGVARYILDAERNGEFAIVVTDTWQGCGLGRRLLHTLIEHARASGIRLLYGDVLATNQPMLRLAQGVGFAIEAHPEGGTLRRIRMSFE
jgi:acetyltransferase